MDYSRNFWDIHNAIKALYYCNNPKEINDTLDKVFAAIKDPEFNVSKKEREILYHKVFKPAEILPALVGLNYQAIPDNLSIDKWMSEGYPNPQNYVPVMSKYPNQNILL